MSVVRARSISRKVGAPRWAARAPWRAVVAAVMCVAGAREVTAQFAPAPSARTLRVDGTRLPRGQFVYETVLEHDLTGTSLGTRTVTMAPAPYKGIGAWLFVESKAGARIAGTDSLYVESSTLRPLHWSSTIGRARLGLEFRDDSAFGGTSAPAGQRSIVSAVPPGALVNAAMLDAVLRLLPIHAAWEDSANTLSVSLGGLTTLPTRISVIGEDNVRVPAGQFDCWVVSVRAADVTRGLYWVTKTDPIVVRSALDVPGMNGAQYVSSLVARN